MRPLGRRCGTLVSVEIIIELVGELVLLALNVTIGVGLLVATYWLWITARRRLWGLDRVVVVETPDGEPYTLEVPGLQVRTPLSRRIFSSDRSHGGSPPGWNKDDRLHPDRIAGSVGDLLIFVMPVLLAGVLLLVLIFVLEVILAGIVLVLVSMAATIIRYRWTCQVTSPGGHVFPVRTRGMRRARRLRDELAEAIRAGDVAAIERAGERSRTDGIGSLKPG